MAEALIRDHLEGGSLRIDVQSAGTLGWNEAPATPYVIEVLAERGIELVGHVSRKITRAQVDDASLIIAMTRTHAWSIAAHDPEAAARTFLDVGAGTGELAREIARAHPGLRVITVHAGGYLPSYLARTDVACRVRNNANCANVRSPREYFRQELLVDTMVLSDEGLRHLVAEVGAGQIVYGTDNPLNWPVTIDLVLDATFLSNAEKEAILGGNALRLLRVS